MSFPCICPDYLPRVNLMRDNKHKIVCASCGRDEPVKPRGKRTVDDNRKPFVKPKAVFKLPRINKRVR